MNNSFARPWVSFACWCLLASGTAQAVAAAAPSDGSDAGILNVDMVFPRNETYAPTSMMPLVFGLGNPLVAQHVRPIIDYEVWRAGDDKNNGSTVLDENLQALMLNWSHLNASDPFVVSTIASVFNTEGHWRITWVMSWASCTPKPHTQMGEVEYSNNHTFREVWFTTKKSAPALDISAELAAGNDACSESPGGIALNVTGALPVPFPKSGDDPYCAVVATALPKPDPCAVKIDAAAASTVAYRLQNDGCLPGSHLQHNDQRNMTLCMAELNGAPRSAVGGAAVLAAVVGGLGAFGGLGFLMWL